MESIGRYRISRELGRGGMGVVYEAQDPVIERAVALKTIRNGDGLDARVYAELSERFLREARAAGRLSHPGIAAVLDAGTDATTGVSYIAMEMIRGGDLDRELRAGRRFTAEEAARLVAAAADALDFAHRQGVVHRDVKPANLLLDESGQVKLTDFGIAHLAESGITRTGQILGSPAYMSPEQITGAPVDGRSDIFSLGVVLYQLLTGERPFLGEGLSTLSYQIVHTEPIPARKLNPSLPPRLDGILARALAKHPSERYARAGEMASELRGEREPAAMGTGTLIAAPAPITTIAAAAAPRSSGGGTVLDAPRSTSAPPAPPSPPVPASPARRRGVTAVAVGALLIAAVASVLALRRVEGPAAAGNATANATPIATPSSPRGLARSEAASTPAPARPAAAAPADADAPARVRIDCEHFLGSGAVTLEVDGQQVWSSPLRARKETRIKVPLLKKGPRIQMSNEKLTADLEIASGRRTVTVRMASRDADIDDSDTQVASLRPGSATVWKIRLNRITRKVGLDVTP